MLEVSLLLLCVTIVELKFFDGDIIAKNLIAYNTENIKKAHELTNEYYSESFYYSPFQAMDDGRNFSKNFVSQHKAKSGSARKSVEQTCQHSKENPKQSKKFGLVILTLHRKSSSNRQVSSFC